MQGATIVDQSVTITLEPSYTLPAAALAASAVWKIFAYTFKSAAIDTQNFAQYTHL